MCGLLHGPQSLAWNCETQKVPACFCTLFVLTSQPPHPHNLTKESWMIYLESPPPHTFYLKDKNKKKTIPHTDTLHMYVHRGGFALSAATVYN